ncbi:MAG: hypothetical protein QW751_01590 [Candidatus Aenigmatarchaeota archaeon]
MRGIQTILLYWIVVAIIGLLVISLLAQRLWGFNIPVPRLG